MNRTDQFFRDRLNLAGRLGIIVSEIMYHSHERPKPKHPYPAHLYEARDLHVRTILKVVEAYGLNSSLLRDLARQVDKNPETLTKMRECFMTGAAESVKELVLGSVNEDYWIYELAEALRRKDDRDAG